MKAASILLTVTLALAATLVLQGSADASRSNILALDVQWQEAIVNGDIEFINKHTADDFTFVHAGERTAETKLDWVKQASTVRREFLLRRVSQQSVEIHGRIAVVFGRLDVRANSSTGTPLCYAVGYVHLYESRNGRWLFLSHVTTQSIEPERPCSE
jgi:ketosteroid isomerase-like protein